jgi:hypothetical protein
MCGGEWLFEPIREPLTVAKYKFMRCKITRNRIRNYKSAYDYVGSLGSNEGAANIDVV